MKVIASFYAAVAVAFVGGSEAAASTKQVYHVHGARALFEQFYGENKQHVDLWSTTSHDDGTIEADVYAAPSVIHRFHESSHRALRTDEEQHALRFLVQEDDTESAATQEELEIATCHTKTGNFIDAVGVNGAPFTASAFHDCWRTSKQIFAFLDKLTQLAPTYFTKLDPIGKTFEGQEIPVYRISAGKHPQKQALVGQSLIHAREWQTGGAVLYIISGLLDALRANDQRVTAIFDKYDWYFVPVLNIDGYDYTWTDGNRLWRKNRRTFTRDNKRYVGVDLNRNFGPETFFDLTDDGKHPNTEIYPGTGVLSEPESAAVFAFLRSLPTNTLAGVIDVHMNSQAILRPFSNQLTEAPEPYKAKLTTLGDTIRAAIEGDSDLAYRNIMGGTGSYLAYGTFKDAVFMELNHTPAFTLELERADGGFISSQTTIRDVGNRTLAAFVAFSEGVGAYWHEACETQV